MTKKVMTFGTFDLFHPGHRYYLEEAKKHGDLLITVIARDTTVLEVKGKFPRESESHRMASVLETGISERVVLGSFDRPYDVISEYRPDVLCFGYDQKSFNNKDLENFLEKNNLHPEIVIVPAFQPEKWKSSIINKI